MINKKIKILVVAGLILAIFAMSLFQVQDGYRKVVLRFGEVTRVVDAGIHLKIPFVEKAIKYEVRTRKSSTPVSASSKDLQDVSTDVTIQYNLDVTRLGELYKNLGVDYNGRIIQPAIQEAVKSSTAQFNATELITKRPAVKDMIEVTLKERLAEVGILLSNIDIVDFSFSASFNQAIEDKVKAEQEALKEKNRLEKVKFMAQQKIEAAKAEAERIRLESQALKDNPQLIAKIYAQAYADAVDNWDGVLPTSMIPNGALPFINLNGKDNK